jgi:hypothetical protein
MVEHFRVHEALHLGTRLDAVWIWLEIRAEWFRHETVSLNPMTRRSQAKQLDGLDGLPSKWVEILQVPSRR